MFNFQPFSIELKVPPNEKLPYGGFIIFVKNGKSRIKQVYKKSEKNEDVYSYLLVNDVSILSWQEKNGCPTCDQIIKTGNNDFDSNQIIRDLNEVTFDQLKSNSDWATTYLPLLEQFEPGIYFLTCNKYYPTDGEARLFWGSYNTPTVSKGINCEYWNDPEYQPSFLIASQSINKFSNERFEGGKTHYKTNPGIAYHLGGFISVLLDGHHRALASASVGDSFECITISKASWYWKGSNHSARLPDAINTIFKQEIESENLSSSAQGWLRKVAKNHSCKEASQHFNFEVLSNNIGFSKISESLTPQLKSYLTIDYMVAAIEASEISDKDIENAYRSEAVDPSLNTILMSFVGSSDPRARPLAFRIVKDDNWMSLWFKALKYLSQFKDQEVLDIFWDFEVNRDVPRKDALDIVNQYVEENSDSYS